MDALGFFNFSRAVEVEDLHLYIDKAAGWHVAACAAPQFVCQVDAIHAAEDAAAMPVIQRDNLADVLQNPARSLP